MGRRTSQLEQAILGIEDEIAALELARNHLIRQRPTPRPATAKPRPAPRPASPRPTAARPVPEDAAS